MKVKEKYWDHWEKKWIVRVFDRPVLEDDGVPEHGTAFKTRVFWYRHQKTALIAHFRFDPVPGTGNRGSRRFGNWYKKPKTTQERRLSYAYGEKYVRGARRDGNLPNAYDDYPRSDRFIKRSWKKCKKRKQWM
jgi:hypothetical protein